MKKTFYVLLCAFVISIISMGYSATRVIAADRIVGEFTSGDLWMKEGPTFAVWKQMTGGVDVGDYALVGDWLTVVDANLGVEDVSIKEPFWNSKWHVVFGGLGYDTKKVATTQRSDGLYRLVVLDTSGRLWLKEGATNSGWWSSTMEPESGTITKLSASGDRIVVLMQDGKLFGKELVPGTYNHPTTIEWELLAEDGSDFALTEDRVAYVDSSNRVNFKEGRLISHWYSGGPGYVFDNAKSIHLFDDKACYINLSDNAYCKKGPLGATTVLTYESVSDIQLSYNRFGVVTLDMSAHIMEGPLYGNSSGWDFIAYRNILSMRLK